MDELKIYVSGIVFAAFASAIAFMLMPKGRIPKYVRISASICVMLLMISPISSLSLKYNTVITSGDTEATDSHSNLELLMKEQQINEARDTFSASVKEILTKNGITPKSVHIYVSADEKEISLDGIEILMDESLTAPEKLKATRIITEVFAIEPSVKIER